MNWKPTWVLLAAAAVMLAFIVLVEHPRRARAERLASRFVLPGLNPAAVTNILVEPWGQPAIQVLRDGSASNSWHLRRPIAYPARGDYVAALLGQLARLEWLDCMTEAELKDRPSAQEDYGFAQPRFTLLLQDAASETRLEVGNLAPYGDRVYLQVVGNPSIYLADSDILKWILPDKNSWRDPALLDLAHLPYQCLQVRSAGQEFDLARDPTNHLWFLTKGSLVARADTPKIDALLAQLQSMRVSGFVNDDPQADLEPFALQDSAATPELALSFLRGTNTVAGLQMGATLTNWTNLAFARRGHPGNIVAVAREPLRPWLAPYTNFLDQHFVSLPPSLVDSIAVRGDGDDPFTVQKQSNGQWRVAVGKTDFPADTELMADWLAALTNVPTAIVKTVVTDFSPYGLVHPALQYTILFSPVAGPPALAQLEFGLNTNGQVFERRLGEDPVNSISPADYFRLPRASWQLRDRTIWNFDPSNVLGVTVLQKGGVLKYLHDPDGNWTYAPGSANQFNLDSAALSECIFRLGRLRAVYWDGVGDRDLERFGFQKEDHRVELAVKNGGKIETLAIQFGARSPYWHPYASVVRDGQRLIFEFPVDLYENLVQSNLTVLSVRLNPR
jgi:hypothetical protein